MTLRQAVNADTLQGRDSPQYSIPEGTIFMLALGPMMRYDRLSYQGILLK